MIENRALNVLHRNRRGFTLVEMAIVLIIVSLLIGGMLMSLTSQQDIANARETEKRLNDVRDALLGFSAANGRLPCPATAASNNGLEEFCTNDVGPDCGLVRNTPPPAPTTGRCVDFFGGFIPAATLGLSPTNEHGFAIDAWGNPIRYAVSNNPNNTTLPLLDYPFTSTPSTTAGLKGVWANDPSQIKPDLRVCSTSVGISSGNCAAGQSLTDNAVAVVFSTGKNGGAPPVAGNADELANWASSTRVFVSATPGPTFDDLVVWLSPNILYNRMISAGRLP